MGKRERDAVARVPLFQALSTRHRKRIADLADEERIMEGATIVRQGEPGDTFYVILEGEAKVRSNGGRTLHTLRPGDFFGEISLLDGGPRTATVVADTPVTVLTVSRSAFLKAVRENPEIGVKLLQNGAAMLRRLETPANG